VGGGVGPFGGQAPKGSFALHFGRTSALVNVSSADIGKDVLSGKPSEKQFVRIAIADANFRTAIELTAKRRFGGQASFGPVREKAAA
jgi:hypothetical protein